MDNKRKQGLVPVRGADTGEVTEPLGPSTSDFERIAHSIFTKFSTIQEGINALECNTGKGAVGQTQLMRSKVQSLNEDDITPDLLTDDQWLKIFGSNGISRLFDRFVEVKVPNTGETIKVKIQDWGSVSEVMIHSHDPKYKDYDTCMTEMAKMDFFQRRGFNLQPTPKKE